MYHFTGQTTLEIFATLWAEVVANFPCVGFERSKLCLAVDWHTYRYVVAGLQAVIHNFLLSILTLVSKKGILSYKYSEPTLQCYIFFCQDAQRGFLTLCPQGNLELNRVVVTTCKMHTVYQIVVNPISRLGVASNAKVF